MFDNAPVVNQFNGVKGVDASVRSQIINWNDKIREYLRDFFDGDIERARGTRFGDDIAKITYITERVVMEPNAFRGVRDVQGRLQAGAIVEEEFDFLYIEAFATAPWNILGNQPDTLKGTGTSLMEELVGESKDLGFQGRLRLYPIQRSKQFYIDVGFVETDGGEMELTPYVADNFLDEQRRFRETGRRAR